MIAETSVAGLVSHRRADSTTTAALSTVEPCNSRNRVENKRDGADDSSVVGLGRNERTPERVVSHLGNTVKATRPGVPPKKAPCQDERAGTISCRSFPGATNTDDGKGFSSERPGGSFERRSTAAVPDHGLADGKKTQRDLDGPYGTFASEQP
ncbi:hypothetical protein THAOC_22410, partial [Thalassiosira oceanica]